MTLTEQWKKGELPKGYYYIKLPTGRMEVISHDSFQYLESETIKNRLEVLAPVPSYEEWQKMKEQRDACAWALDKIGDVLVRHKLVEKTDNAIGENK